MSLVVRLTFTDAAGRDRVLGFDVVEDLAEIVVSWWRLRRAGRRPRLRLERARLE
jgi:hypothetical protein